jgi:hypothetical protein
VSRFISGAVVLVALIAVVFVGCTSQTGPKTVPVKGTLTIDGAPAENITLSLAPLESSNPVATGVVSGGAFELYSGVQGAKGAVPGKYKVVLAASGASSKEEAMKKYAGGAAGGNKSELKAAALPFPEKYASSATSDKEVEITADGADLKIDITK